MDNSYKGKILISAPDASGDIFSRSVVLIIEHNDDGAFGLILNKENKSLSHSLPAIIGRNLTIYEGGPVAREKLFFIIKGKNTIFSEALEINNDYYMTAEMEKVVESLMDNLIQTKDIKAFSGYSGWTGQQLETEVANKFWTVLDTPNLSYIAPNDQRLWKELTKSLGGEFLLWVNTPEDIRQN